MTDLTGRQWHMVPKVNSKPGSQGTLFDAPTRTARNGGQPWPRGFSPQRRDEVRDALDPGWGPARLQGQRGKPALDIHKEKTQGGTKPESVRGIETIARSTVPVEHLEGLQGIWFGQHPGPQSKDATGSYYRYGFSGKPDKPRPPEIAVYQGAAATPTVIHEIGHHVSAQAGNEHADYETPQQKGTEEAFAENYSDTHYRDHRGRPLTESRISARAWTRDWPSDLGRAQFTHAFEAERRKSPIQPKVVDLTPKDPETKRRVKGQLPLLDKVYTGVRGDVSWEYANLDDLRGRNEFLWRDRRNG